MPGSRSAMDPERWRQIDDLFHRLLSVEPGRRDEALAAATAADEELREELASLLAAHDDTGSSDKMWTTSTPVARLASELLGRNEEAEAELPISETLGRFRVFDLLGAGGMGAVFRAFDPELRRTVAVKVLAQGRRDPEAHQRLLREARAAAALRHPSIATVFEIGEDRGTSFIVMECVEGETLARRLADGPFPLRETVTVAVQIAEALEEAHRYGVIHRDIKAANVMLTPRRGVKVLDFGLACHPAAGGEDPASALRALGTPAAMSPEQAAGQPLDHRTDIFSFGILLHQMLTGRSPFAGATVGETVERILHAPSPPLPAGLPPELYRIVSRCLAKDRETRYPSAAELLADLRSVAHTVEAESTGAPISAGRAERPRRVLPVRPRVVLAGVLALLAMAAAGFLLSLRETAVERSAIRSLAVLPLADLSPPPRESYFADGLTEALITEMAKIRALRVIARSSVMAFRDAPAPASTIARRLDVGALLTGSVTRTAGEVRVSVQLVHGPSDRVLWAESYKRAPRDIVALQEEIARAVAREIRLRLTPEDESRLRRAKIVVPEAYESYLRGRYFWNQRSKESLEKAIASFADAIRRNPDDPLAYAALADSYVLLAPYGGRPPETTYPRAEAAARRALDLDPALGQAYATQGVIQHELYWNHTAAEQSFRRALELAPGYATAHQWYAEMLTRLGRSEEARLQIREAQRLDPLSLIVNSVAGWVDYNAGRSSEAVAQLQSTLELDPRFVPAWSYLGLAYASRGQYREAIAAHREALRLSGRAPRQLADLGITLAQAGQVAEARGLLSELAAAARRQHIPALHFAGLHLALGDREQALDLLESAAGERGVWMLFLKVDPRFAALRDEPRFQALLARTGLLSPGPSKLSGR